MKIIGVIPARARSIRFPNKPLTIIAGLPMIIHVARKVELAFGKENTFIATDDNQILNTCQQYGFKAIMTSPNCKTGTDRIAEFAEKIEADIYINVQGDEPLVSPIDILNVSKAKIIHPDKVVNAMCNLLDDEDPNDINIPKILVSKDGLLIYASRLAIPGIKDKREGVPKYKKQVCIYAFSRNELLSFQAYKDKAISESFEDIEILRFLDAGIPVFMLELNQSTIAVDVPADVDRVEKFLLRHTHH